MSLIKTNENDVTSVLSYPTTAKVPNNLVVRVNQDSDDNLQALFDSVLNPGESNRPLQVPFRMRKLPNSFFHPPAVSNKPTVSHSRANSADSAYDTGSQSNVNQDVSSMVSLSKSTTPSASNFTLVSDKLPICHSRARSSPASLQQSLVGVEREDILQNEAGAAGVPEFNARNINFTPDIHSKLVSEERFSHGVKDTPSIPVHMKQRSYDVVSPLQLQNELGSLPPGWEQAKTNDGQIYYLNHSTKTTQWEDPRNTFRTQKISQQSFLQAVNIKCAAKDSIALHDNMGPLPEGWEQALTESGDIYFINHINRTTSWNDPRIPDFFQKSIKLQKAEPNWINQRHFEKEPELYKHKPEQLAAQGVGLHIDPFLSGDNHARQESSDSGLSLSSNTFSVNNDLLPQLDDSMDCISENNSLNTLSGLDCPDNLVSSLQLEDNICNEMFSDVQNMFNVSANKSDNLEWYKIN